MKRILKFYSDTCSPCKTLTPHIEELKKLYPQIEFEDVNIETEEFLTEACGISSVPTVVFMNKNKEFARVIGTNIKSLKDTTKKFVEGV